MILQPLNLHGYSGGWHNKRLYGNSHGSTKPGKGYNCIQHIRNTRDNSWDYITLTVPYGTDPTSLTPTIVITGASVSPASGVPHNFTTPQTYTVTAADSSTQAYTVTVTVGLSPETFTADGVSFNMIYVPGKSFPTGTDDLGTATVASAYWIGETQVTYELWNKVYTWAIANGYTFANSGHMGGGTGIHQSAPCNCH